MVYSWTAVQAMGSSPMEDRKSFSMVLLEVRILLYEPSVLALTLKWFQPATTWRVRWFDSTLGHQEQRVSYIIQYELSRYPILPASNSTELQCNRWVVIYFIGDTSKMFSTNYGILYKYYSKATAFNNFHKENDHEKSSSSFSNCIVERIGFGSMWQR